MQDHPIEMANVYLQVNTGKNHRDYKSQISLIKKCFAFIQY